MNMFLISSWTFLACLAWCQAGCDKGWFGSNCEYKCHCTDGMCDESSGVCNGSARCEEGWFGPSCQYADLALVYMPKGDVNPYWAVITDGNDSTCFSDTREYQVALTLTQANQITWMRVVVRDPYYLDKFDIKFKNVSNTEIVICTNKRTAPINEATMDIHCDVNNVVDQVLLNGPGVGFICSLYISGGRNVALKQTTQQSSDYKDISRAESSNAVDGDTRAWHGSASCTHTEEGDKNPNWNVTFSRPAAANRYVIYNRNEGEHVDQRLQGFLLRSFAPNGTEVFTHRDQGPPDVEVYTVTSLAKPVLVVDIKTFKVTSNKIVVTLCEVEVYGDSICEPGSFGRECENRCRCADPSEACFVSTGACPSGCLAGFQGESCTTECDKGWFGNRCQYRCRCQHDLCNATDGSCIGGSTCQIGWFGPACQYEDMTQSTTLEKASPPPVVLTDADDYTCINQDVTEVTLRWKVAYQFTWLRIYVKDTEFLNKITVHFKNDSDSSIIDCTNQRQSKVNNRAVDIHCDMNQTAKQVVLSGQAVKYLCSVYVSGGRNVAIKQKTRQSSTYYSLIANSGRAVDGKRSSNYYQYSCTHTANGDVDPVWSVVFSQNVTVNRYVLYNRDTHTHRLQSFLLDSTDKAGMHLFRFTDTTPTAQGIYTVTSTAPMFPVSAVNIRAVKPEGNSVFLTLCEVEVYGDSLCEPGQYGRECEFTCDCVETNETCFVSTGGCPYQCRPGYQGDSCSEVCTEGTHGQHCSSTCPELCQRNEANIPVCDHVHGTCLLGCQAGYTGPMCYEKCRNGTYGQGCSLLCPQFCGLTSDRLPLCHHVLGTCLQGCQAGYIGPMCDASCETGTFGQDCRLRCSQFCSAEIDGQPACNNIDGTCFDGCKPGYDGPLCIDPCENGIYGDSCSQFCPQTCASVNDTEIVCDNVNGTCQQGCVPGFTGPMCQEECEDGTYGEECKQTCSQFCVVNDTNKPVCDPTTGMCRNGCLSGYRGITCDEVCSYGKYGPRCTMTCPDFCEVDDTNRPVCHHIHGECVQGCQTGYKGSMCAEMCERGAYGDGCQKVCPHNCESNNTSDRICNLVDGSCEQGCQAGFQGLMCNEFCTNGTHGLGCNQTCPEFCAIHNTSEPTCHHVNGECLQGCQFGYKGPSCAEICESGTYGEGCQNVCPQYCEKKNMAVPVCHHVDGTCLQGCQAGYLGVTCNESCSDGTYGQACKHSCPQFCQTSSSNMPVCNHVSGTCLQGCLAGYEGSLCNETCGHGAYGEGCQNVCPQYCENRNENDPICHNVDGTCIQGCQAGYLGVTCNESCSDGTYGQGCKHSCPQFCQTSSSNIPVCNHVSGTCLQGCLAGYEGSRCNETCGSGAYGEGCRNVCSEYCKNSNENDLICHHVDGTCIQGCQAGYLGVTCNASCSDGTYGQACKYSCSQFCQTSSSNMPVCNHVSGTCLQGCLAGYKGSQCNERCGNNSYGQDCKHRCSQFCERIDTSEQVCNHIDGACLYGCQAGYMEPVCLDTCENGTYGLKCNETCPQICEVVNATLPVCHHVHGTCLHGCHIGFNAPLCPKQTAEASANVHRSSSSSAVWVSVAVLTVGAVVCIGLVVLWKSKKLISIKHWITNDRNVLKTDSTENIVTTEMESVQTTD